MSLRPYLELVRLPAIFTAPSDVLAGCAIASMGGVQIGGLSIVLAVVASACVYTAGMALNDIFDAKIDAEERAGRPIPSGRVSLQSAWALALTLQGLALGISAGVGGACLGMVALTIGLTYAYNAALKDGPIGPWVMGACRYGNALIGAAIVGWPGGLSGWLPLGTLVYVVFLTLLSRHEVDGANPADVQRPIWGLRVMATLPVVWILAGVLPVIWAAALVILPLGWLWRPTQQALSTPNASSVRGVVMAGIYGIALINGVIAAGAGSFGLAAIAVGLLVPGRFFGRWFYAT